MPAQPSNSVIYQQSLVDARAAWAQKSGLTQAQVKGAYQQAAVSLGSRVAAAPPTAPSTAWNLGQLQTVIQDYASTLDQRVIDAMHSGIYASFHDSADSVLKAGVSDAYGSVFGPEAIDAHVRGINQRAAASYITRTGKDGIKLSDRVWKANQQWRAATQSVVQNAVIAGQPPVQVAKQIEQYLKPGVNVPYKEETAKRLHVPKDTSMPAMRVARTEMQNAFHEGTISSHGSMPSYLGIRWVISHGAGHVPDICDTYAAQGFFPKGTEPLKPHPHCFCTAVPVHRDSADVLNDLDEWLSNPGSHPELEDYYQNDLKPLLDVEVASVAGAAGGPLQGGYAKGDKVLIDVKGQQVIATINGETVSKGVLTMIIDPGQGLASIKVWRAPSKVQPYAGPPTQAVPLNPGPPPPSPTGIDVGTVVHANVGQHAGKVGTVTAVNLTGGTYHVKWTDGTENNVVAQNLVKAPPPPALSVGMQVKIHSPETPMVDGQIGEVTAIDASGQATVSVHVPGQGQFAFDLPKDATFKLEPQVAPPPAGPQPGWTAESAGMKLTLVKQTSPTTWEAALPSGMTLEFETVLLSNIQPPPGAAPQPAPPQPASPPTVIGYLDAPGSIHHGKKVIGQPDPTTVQFEDGTYGHGYDASDISQHDPLAAPPPPPAPPIPIPPAHPFGVGDHIQIDDPTLAVNGQQGVIEAITPTQVQVKMADGTSFFLHPDDLVTSVKSLASTPQVQGVRPEATINDLAPYDPVRIKDPLHGDYNKVFYLGDETPAWYSDTQEIALYASVADAKNEHNPVYFAKKKLGPEVGFLVHSKLPLHQLLTGEEVLIQIGAPHGGETGILQSDLLGKPADASVSVLLGNGTAVSVYVNELTLPPTPAVKTLESLKAGDKVQVNFPGSPHNGKVVTLSEDFLPGAFMAVDEIPGYTFGSSELMLPPTAGPIATAWQHLKAGDKVKVNLPSSVHHGEEVTLYDDLAGMSPTDIITVTLADGSLWSYEVQQVAPIPGTPVQPSAHVAPMQGMNAQVNVPADSMHGEQVVLLESKPGASLTTPMKVEYLTGPNKGDTDFWPLSALVTPGTVITPSPPGTPVVAHTPPGAVAVDVTQKGTKVVTDYKGQRDVTGTVVSFNAGKNVLVIKPDDATLLAGGPKPTFTKNPKYVKPTVDPNAAPPPPAPVQTQVTTPPPPSVAHLTVGDNAVVNMPGTPNHGEAVILHESLAGKSPTDSFTAHLATGPNSGNLVHLYTGDIVPPGTPISTTPPPGTPATPPPTAHTWTVGDAVLDIDGKVGVVTHVTPASVEIHVAGQIGSQVYDSPGLIAQLTKPTPVAPPTAPGQPPTPTPAPAAAPTQTVTTKGALVTTEYQGQHIQAVVKSFNAGKNVVKLTPLVPTPNVPNTFEKSPKKLTLVTPPTVTPSPAPSVPTTAPAPGHTPPVVPASIPPDPPKPNPSTFTLKSNQNVGGGHAKTLYTAPDGKTWMFKPDQTAALAEKAGYTVQNLVGLATPEIHVMTHGGQVGSMQSFHDGVKGEVTFSSIGSLTAAQRADIQAHQVVDWMISQHDSNQGAMLIGADDHILAVDKGQAFKFLGRDRLDWKYAPNPDSIVYKPLFEGYIGGRYALQRSAVEPIIARFEALDDNLFKAAIKPYADYAAQQGLVTSPEVIYDQLLKRKHSLREDFDKLYDAADAAAGRSSGPSLKAGPTVVAPPAVVATSTTSANVVTPVTQVLADNVVRAGTHGKAVLVAGTDIENGAVHVYQMKVSGDGTRLVVSARVRADAESKLLNHLEGLPAQGAAYSSGYTPPPAADPAWTTTLKMLKHFNTHLKAGADQALTPGNLNELIGLAKQVMANSNNWTAHKSQYYADLLTRITGTSDIAELSNMTAAALDAKVKATWQNNPNMLGAAFNEYVAPVVAAPAAAAAPPAQQGKFKARKAQPSYLKRLLVNGDLVTDGTTRTTLERDGIVGDHEYFVDDLGPGMSAQYMPHFGHATTGHSNNPYARHGRLDITIDNWQGDSAAIELGMSKLRELGLDATPATPKDVELLYLVHQVHAMKLEQASDYQTMRAGINDTTPIDESIAKYQTYLSGKLGKDITKMPTYNPVAKFNRGYRVAGANGHEFVEDVGRPHFDRIDITSADLKRALPKYVLTHRSGAGTEGFLQILLEGNGAAANTEERVRQALFDPRQGMSSVADMFSGGANYFFTRLAKSNTRQGHRGAFWFNTDLMLQTDVIAYTRDKFGQSDPTTKNTRLTKLDEWKAQQHVADDNEVIIKNGFNAFDYLERISASTQAERLKFIKMFKDRGIDTLHGVPVEDIVQVGFPA